MDKHCGEGSTFSATVSGSLLWSYDEPAGRIGELYEIAKAQAWNASGALRWQERPPHDLSPLREEYNPLRGFAPFEQLSAQEQRKVCWLVHGQQLSEILHGEQGALLLASQLVSCMPTQEAKLFASAQVADEARHVEFFSRYLREIVGEVHPPGKELKKLLCSVVEEPRWHIKMIACQILIESLALARLQEIRVSANVPLLQCAIDYILRDEARHVSFGTQFLRDYLAGLPRQELEDCGRYVVDNVLSLINSLNVFGAVAGRMGWDGFALRHHLRRQRALEPQRARNNLKFLVQNLRRSGLMTEPVRERLMSVGVME